MRDLVEMSSFIDPNLTDEEKRFKFCEELLNEFKCMDIEEFLEYFSSAKIRVKEKRCEIVLNINLWFQVIDSIRCRRCEDWTNRSPLRTSYRTRNYLKEVKYETGEC